jgi:outer membrane receptor protein involved in Fe transport
VAKTLEIGARGKSGDSSWSAAIYRTELSDDIQFVSAGGSAINAGFFQNVGKTQRRGIELSGATKWGSLGFTARYSLIDATFKTGFVESSPANSAADANGDIVVAPGSRIPGIPRQSLRVRVDWQASEAFSVGANLVANSGSRLRGDESNQDLRGQVPGYAVLNLDARWKLRKNLELFARVDNVFDREYANFGVLGRNAFANPRSRSIPRTPRPSRSTGSARRAARGSGCAASGSECARHRSG